MDRAADKDVTILAQPECEPDACFALILLSEGGQPLAVGPSARKLADAAFGAGARTVRFDFDLALED